MIHIVAVCTEKPPKVHHRSRFPLVFCWNNNRWFFLPPERTMMQLVKFWEGIALGSEWISLLLMARNVASTTERSYKTKRKWWSKFSYQLVQDFLYQHYVICGHLKRFLAVPGLHDCMPFVIAFLCFNRGASIDWNLFVTYSGNILGIFSSISKGLTVGFWCRTFARFRILFSQSVLVPCSTSSRICEAEIMVISMESQSKSEPMNHMFLLRILLQIWHQAIESQATGTGAQVTAMIWRHRKVPWEWGKNRPSQVGLKLLLKFTAKCCSVIQMVELFPHSKGMSYISQVGKNWWLAFLPPDLADTFWGEFSVEIFSLFKNMYDSSPQTCFGPSFWGEHFCDFFLTYIFEPFWKHHLYLNHPSGGNVEISVVVREACSIEDTKPAKWNADGDGRKGCSPRSLTDVQ